MSKLFYTYRQIILVALIAITGCEKNDIPSGDLEGLAAQHTLDSRSIFLAPGIKVKFSNSNVTRTTKTDSNGWYRFNDLPSGTYNVLVTRDSFSEYKHYGYSHIGGSPDYSPINAFIYELNKVELKNLTISDVREMSTREYEINGKVNISNTDSLSRYNDFVRYYIHTSEDVSYKNYLATGMEELRDGFQNTENNYDLVVDLRDLNIKAGTKVYIVLYPTIDSRTSYFDIKAGTDIYQAINRHNPSDIVSFTIPE